MLLLIIILALLFAGGAVITAIRDGAPVADSGSLGPLSSLS